MSMFKVQSRTVLALAAAGLVGCGAEPAPRDLTLGNPRATFLAEGAVCFNEGDIQCGKDVLLACSGGNYVFVGDCYSCERTETTDRFPTLEPGQTVNARFACASSLPAQPVQHPTLLNVPANRGSVRALPGLPLTTALPPRPITDAPPPAGSSTRDVFTGGAGDGTDPHSWTSGE